MSMTTFQKPVVSILQRRTIESLLEKGNRIDGRGLQDFRDIRVELRYINKAEGSALVKLGETIVLAGVKIEPGTPFPDTPNQGLLMVNAEFVPLASPSFEPGPPDENAVELARVIDRSIRELNVVDLESLAVIPGKRVLGVWIDLYILNHDGNLHDASMLASMLALLDTRLPGYKVEDDEIILDKQVRGERLKINDRVVSITIAKIGNYYVVDPNLEEESIADTRIFIAVSRDKKIAGIQKMGMTSIPLADMDKIIDIALEKGEELHQKIDNILSNHSQE